MDTCGIKGPRLGQKGGIRNGVAQNSYTTFPHSGHLQYLVDSGEEGVWADEGGLDGRG